MAGLIDPAPFEPYMPDAVRRAIADAREGRGPAKAWLEDEGFGQVDACMRLLREPGDATADVIGWLSGMAMFGDRLDSVASTMRRAPAIGETAMHALDAIAAGLRAGVSTRKRQWRSIEDVAQLAAQIPQSLVEVLPIALVSDQSLDRGVALRLARRVGAPARAVIAAERDRQTGKARKQLDEALASLGEEVQERAAHDLLPRLVEAWASTRDPALKDFIVAFGAEAARAAPPITAKSKAELEVAWHSVASARRAEDVDRLLGTPWPAAWKTAFARVSVLAKFTADPRIARGLEAVRPSYTSQAAYAIRRDIDSIVRFMGGDPRGNADPALLEEARTRAPTRTDLDGAWRAFFDDPGNAEKRLVLADALQQAGDARGEFIALSMAIANGDADSKVQRRAKALLDANVDVWTGPLPAVERSSRKFERGFLTRLRTSARPELLVGSADEPAWRTVEHLELTARWEDMREAVRTLLPRLPLLRTLLVSAYAARVLDSLETESSSSVRTLGWFDGVPLPDLRAFPGLTMIAGFGRSARLGLIETARRRDLALLLGHVRFDELGQVARDFDEHGGRELRILFDDDTAVCVRLFRDGRRAEVASPRGRTEKDAPERYAAALAGWELTRTPTIDPWTIAV